MRYDTFCESRVSRSQLGERQTGSEVVLKIATQKCLSFYPFRVFVVNNFIGLSVSFFQVLPLVFFRAYFG